MFSRELKQHIASQVQQILKETERHELPEGEIQFILHVDGAESMSWANIRNNGSVENDVPVVLIRNTSV